MYFSDNTIDLFGDRYSSLITSIDQINVKSLEITYDFQKKAMTCLIAAAENGNWTSQNELAQCYLNGKGINIDLSQAYAWLELLADKYSDLAATRRSEGEVVFSSDGQAMQAKRQALSITSRMTNSQLEIGKRLYREFKIKYWA